MVKTSSMVYKSLVVGVIVLFIGVGIQPAFAVTPDTSDSDEDCNICPKVSNLRLVLLERLVNRFETLISKLSVVSKLNPVIDEKYKELSDAITTFKEMNKELQFERPLIIRRILCGIALIICIVVVIISTFILVQPWFEEFWDKVIAPITYTVLTITALLCEPFAPLEL